MPLRRLKVIEQAWKGANGNGGVKVMVSGYMVSGYMGMAIGCLESSMREATEKVGGKQWHGAGTDKGNQLQ